MPELPEVETVCRGLAPVIEGRRVAAVQVRRRDLRIPVPADLADRLTGRTVRRVARRAKYLLLHLDSDDVAIAHLGMSGRLYVLQDGDAAEAPGAHDHLIVDFDGGATVRFRDPRRFGLVTLCRENDLAGHKLLAGLGPEPLGNGFNGPSLAAALAGRNTPIKAALLDQKTVAGLGNIYVCEALFYAGLSPRRKASTVRGRRAERLVAAVKDVLVRAIAAGGSSLRDYVQPTGQLGYFQHRWAVYGREGEACPGCTCDIVRTGGIARIVQSNRSTFFCPRLQL